MRVYVYPADTAGCGYYRLIWPAKHLQKLGYDVRIVHPDIPNKITGARDETGRLVQIGIPKDADVMVFQRLSSKMMIDGIRLIRESANVAVVVDWDDDARAIHPNNPAFLSLHPSQKGELADYDWQSAQRVAEEATLVTVSSDTLLARYGMPKRQGDPMRGVILRNCIPEVFIRIKHEETHDTIGWGGSMHSHPDDPDVVGTAMTRIVQEGYKFKIVGPPRGTKAAFRLNDDPPATGPVPIERYPHEITKLAVGIAPLKDTRFNEAKSWLKMLEYAALGVPCIGSPRAEYRRLHSLGVGLLADNPREWYRHAQRLLSNDAYRLEMSERGRAAVAQLTIENNAWRWAEAWELAYNMQHGLSKIEVAG